MKKNSKSKSLLSVDSSTTQKIQKIVRAALQEDIGPGDLTTDSIVPADLKLEGEFIAKESGIIAGLEIAGLCFRELDDTIQFLSGIQDGEAVSAGQVFAGISGSARAILSAERTALNFLQRMSGIATATSHFVEAVRGTNAVILDTRKTVPGLRILDKWAVLIGGGQNHRTGLYDMVLIKDNHITAAGGITEAVRRARHKTGKNPLIEVEVKNLTELQEALDLKVDRILLDNMSITDMKKAVEITGGQIPLEASGNVTLETVKEIAVTGVDYISAGALTHSVKALDISLLLPGTN
ncbi:MAG: carboxylating nicotinate-nucleotide diphosphorylase [Calditrichaeota bacterium]|nr:MAG: carboxylating nicotinate-nucleotide diphosphorylase [Calditrichota bacterium]